VTGIKRAKVTSILPNPVVLSSGEESRLKPNQIAARPSRPHSLGRRTLCGVWHARGTRLP